MNHTETPVAPDGRLGRRDDAPTDHAIADEWVFVGMHTGPIALPDGKIVVDNRYYDNLAVAAHVGLLPQDAPTTV